MNSAGASALGEKGAIAKPSPETCSLAVNATPKLAPAPLNHPSPPASPAQVLRESSTRPNDVPWTDILLVIFNGLLAIFTFLLWRATAGLWDATRGMLEKATEQSVDLKASIEAARSSAEAAHRSAGIAERTLQLTQRPVMSLENLGSRLVPSKEGGATLGALEIVPHWKNVGPSFALNCHLENSFAVGAAPGLSLSNDEASGAVKPNVGSIGPGGSIDGMPILIPIADLDTAFGQSVPLIVTVCCRYIGAAMPEAQAPPLATISSFSLEMVGDPIEWKMASDPPIRFLSYAASSFAS